MKLFQFVHCNDCDMEYKIIWEDDNFEQPTKCASCGSEELEVEHSGFMS